MNRLLQVILLCSVFNACVPCANPTRPNLLRSSEKLFLNFPNLTARSIFQIFLIQLGLVIFLSLCSSHLKVRYVSFDTDLSTLRKSYIGKKDQSHLYLILSCMLISDNPSYINIAVLFHDPFDIPSFGSIFFTRRKLISRVSPFFLSLNMSTFAVCPSSHFLCLVIMFLTSWTTRIHGLSILFDVELAEARFPHIWPPLMILHMTSI